ncbi:MAG TPA: hypothetical protein VII33_20025, partial [Nakamurella sp.]
MTAAPGGDHDGDHDVGASPCHDICFHDIPGHDIPGHDIRGFDHVCGRCGRRRPVLAAPHRSSTRQEQPMIVDLPTTNSSKINKALVDMREQG